MTQLHVSEITAKHGNWYAQIGNEIVYQIITLIVFSLYMEH